ncbi:MAG: hypothetical protein QME46_03915 [Thermoanaerobacteraceae bacterium]|nr:hypothetical protein [Thermoanaerobacteraceae bacterium]
MKKWLMLIAAVLIAAMVIPVFAAPREEGQKQEFIKIDVRKPAFYPPGKASFTSPEDYVYAFFDALYYAANIPDDSEAHSGTISMEEPYEYAYGLLSDSYKDGLKFNDFVESWENTANVAMIKLIPAGFEKVGQFTYPRFFYETVNTEVYGGKSTFVIYNGFVVLEKYESGYRIKSITKEPEDMVSYVTGSATWMNNPYLKALTFMGNPEDYKTSDGEKYTVLEGDKATVRIAGRSIYLTRLTNNTWKILYWEDKIQ